MRRRGIQPILLSTKGGHGPHTGRGLRRRRSGLGRDRSSAFRGATSGSGGDRWTGRVRRRRAGWRESWLTGVSLALPAMLGGVSGAAEREAEGNAVGAVPAPPAIDFPAEGSDPKYDGEEHGMRRPSPPPSAFILGAAGGCEVRARTWTSWAGSRPEWGPAVQCRGRAGRLD